MKKIALCFLLCTVLALPAGCGGETSASAASSLAGRTLVVGGQSIGVIMRTDGVMIVGFSGIAGDDGALSYPGRDSDLRLGDCIVAVDGTTVAGDEDAAARIDASGDDGQVRLLIRRGGREQDKLVHSAWCGETQSYRLGLYIRDDTGGVGTLTYYDPLDGRYGALGHTVSGAGGGSDDGQLIGRITAARITGIHRAGQGETGEKLGSFVTGGMDGEIDNTNIFGIFGVLSVPPADSLSPPLPVALPEQVEEGPARIITVLAEQEMAWYDVEILDVDTRNDEGKGIKLEITDEALLTATGGIVQGMSGSPIIQNGRLAGAVTYVVVDRPQRGYGCFITDMLAADDLQK